ncbi:hypothetical protein Tco_1512609, partial [Tanacetum coccineum]
LSVDSMLNWSDHEGEDVENGDAQVYGMIPGAEDDATGDATGDVADDVSSAAAEFALMGISSQLLYLDSTKFEPMSYVRSRLIIKDWNSTPMKNQMELEIQQGVFVGEGRDFTNLSYPSIPTTQEGFCKKLEANDDSVVDFYGKYAQLFKDVKNQNEEFVQPNTDSDGENDIDDGLDDGLEDDVTDEEEAGDEEESGDDDVGDIDEDALGSSGEGDGGEGDAKASGDKDDASVGEEDGSEGEYGSEDDSGMKIVQMEMVKMVKIRIWLMLKRLMV